MSGPGPLERLLFRKVELWVVGLLLAFFIVVLVVFGMLVRNVAKGWDKFGLAGEIAYNIASIPATVQELLKNADPMMAYEGDTRFAGRSGWTRYDPAQFEDEAGKILLSRYDGDIRRAVVELYDLASGTLDWRWAPDYEAVYAGVQPDERYGGTVDNARFRVIHPLLFDNGDLLIKDHDTPMARIDACGRKVWTSAVAFHHSTEPAPDGTLWISGLNRPSTVKVVEHTFEDDAVVNMSVDGEVLSTHSVARALLDNGYEWLFAGMAFERENAPLHLNDVQPVPGDGPYWKAGDLFISLRHRSTLLLYRPSTGEIPWVGTGPWYFQHDVDVLDDHTIAVFSNNMNIAVITPAEGQTNRIITYDFATGQTGELMAEAMRREDVRTQSEGLFTRLPGGQVMVEEENFGRLLVFAADGSVAAEFINGAGDGKVFRMGWSRYIPADLAAPALAALRAADCG